MIQLKHQSFVYTQLNDKTVLFQTVQFSISHLFALCLNVKKFLCDPYIGHYQVILLLARVDLGVMTIKGYPTFLKAAALLGPHHQIV